MDHKKTIIERAFDLARVWDCSSVADIRETLSREGYESVSGHLGGQMITRQLNTLLRDRKAVANVGKQA